MVLRLSNETPWTARFPASTEEIRGEERSPGEVSVDANLPWWSVCFPHPVYTSSPCSRPPDIFAHFSAPSQKTPEKKSIASGKAKHSPLSRKIEAEKQIEKCLCLPGQLGRGIGAGLLVARGLLLGLERE